MNGIALIPPGSGGGFDALFPGRAPHSILCGGLTFLERWRLLLPEYFDESHAGSGTIVAVDSLAIPNISVRDAIGAGREGAVWTSGGLPIAALVPRERQRDGVSAFDEICGDRNEAIEVKGVQTARSPWDLIALNGEMIGRDLALVESLGCEGLGAVSPPTATEALRFDQVSHIGDSALRIGADSHIEPFVLLDTREGPIWIGSRVTIEANSILRGPLWIRDDVIVRGGAKIGEGTSIGEGCRIGGEVEATIFGALSNKQHAGFLGHSVVGEWVNLGAATDNSDLKNNYGNVRVNLGHGPEETGRMKIGCFLGDHVKSAIGTRISTGSAVGPCSNLFGPSGLVSGWIPPFTWGEDGSTCHEFDKAVETMREMYRRRARLLARVGRDCEPDVAEVDALRALYDRVS